MSGAPAGLWRWPKRRCGYGIYRCLGARLAELQLTTLIEEMAKRDMEVKHAAPPERIPSCFTNGFHHMLLTVKRS